MNRFVFIVLFLMTTTLSIKAQALSIVVHPSNSDSLSKEQIARIFLGKLKEFPSGETAIPITLSESDSSTQKFVRDVLKKSPAQLKSYWARLVFTGQGEPPEAVTSDQDVISKVAANPGMIGFVSDAAPAGVKVIATF